MLVKLQNLMASMRNDYLSSLLDQFFGCPERVKAYTTAPAAKLYHHARLGGLLEHSLHVAQICDCLATVYPGVDRDLLLTGAILHDVGKTEELFWPGIIEYTDSGKLLGHIVIGINQIRTLIEKISGFPPELELKLLHLIASHHGRYEWQSPKRPKFLEASLLHHADLVDAEADQFLHAPEEGQGNWSAFSKALGRSVYKPGKELKSPEKEI
jgi:3'-5' exoribonuclease